MDTEKSKNQPVKEIVFAYFIQKVFGIEPEDFSEKMEVPVASKLLMVKGRIDAVFGNLLMSLPIGMDPCKNKRYGDFPSAWYTKTAERTEHWNQIEPDMEEEGVFSRHTVG